MERKTSARRGSIVVAAGEKRVVARETGVVFRAQVRPGVCYGVDNGRVFATLVYCIVQIIFPVSRRNSSAPAAPRVKLVSTSEVKTLFSVEDVKLPPWLDGMCLAEYLPAIEDNLKLQVVEAIASIGARRRFIEALSPLFGRPLEADPVLCRRATVLCASGAFTFLVHFSIPTQFPKQQPTLVMQSSQHFNSQGTPISSPLINDYPWSPRWDPPQMAERIFEFLVDECLNFKKFCIDAIPQ
ncbi:uncharacterized protein LOC135608855 [Musa acuminata AAA Group]|uniref:uncharacterized protein LOC135608855 n=1 Tax=Musa acuminata AAA Group TaxID=214697 RepID=UPI0031D8C8FE